MNKSIGDKLAASLRQAKGSVAQQTNNPGTGQNTANAVSEPRKPVAKKVTRSGKKSLPPNLDSSLKKLHPERIWPD